jgi:probable phosphoglycerate mutase
MLKRRPFYYLRHGQTDWNLEHKAQGQTDVPLNEAGRSQARSAVDKLRGAGIVSICCSPLRRAKETALIIAEVLRLNVIVIDDLKEAGWGVYEGKRKDAWFSQWRSGVTPEGAETYMQFLDRALIGLNAALELPEPVLIVSHGGTYWAVERATGIVLGEDVPNCAPVFHKPPGQSGNEWCIDIL